MKLAFPRLVALLLLPLLFLAACDGDDDDNDDNDSVDDDVTDDDAAADDDDDTGDDDDDATPYDDSELCAFIEQVMAATHIPGLAAGIVKDGSLVWSKGFGWAHIQQQRPVTEDTIFMLASVSKTVTAVALMQVWEDGYFELDDNVNDYLAFTAENPNHLGAPITFRQLLTHTSSIRDNWLVMSPLYVQGDSPLPLGGFLEDYLAPGGEYYYAALNYYQYAPGVDWNYSNMGITLAAYLVEALTGTPFDQYCDDNIFAALGMTDTSWFLAGLDETKIAMPYEYLPVLDNYRPYGQYGFPDYPDGQLRTPLKQLAKFQMAFIGDGEWDGRRILEAATVEEMRRQQAPDVDPTQGLVWYYTPQLGTDTILLGHNGGDDGVATEMFYRVSDGLGFILLMNTDWTTPIYHQAMEIERRLLAAGEEIAN
ncbi:MAG TPA: serine hydrolase domain-containing protein [bacterium]|nr:serine hydrolase domain-containing protein [bacterium]